MSTRGQSSNRGRGFRSQSSNRGQSSNRRGGSRGQSSNRGRGYPSNRGRGRGYPSNRNETPDRGYDQHIKREQPPPAVFFVFDGVTVANRYGNVNLKSININDLTEKDRLKIINDANLIIKNFSKPEDNADNSSD